MKKKKILILGGYGFLGSYLHSYLIKNTKYLITRQSRKKYADIVFDPNKKKELFKNLKKVQPNIIINLISCIDLKKCETNIEYAIKANINITENVSNFVGSNRNVYLINISTDHLYSLNGRNDENSIFPLNFYAISKFLAEKYVQDVGGCNLRVNFIGRNRLSKSFLNWAYLSLIKNKKINGYYNVIFNPLNIEKLSQVVTNVAKKKLRGNFNVGAEGKISKYKVLKIFEKKLAKKNLVKKTEYKHKKNLLERPKNMVMSNIKILKYLNIKNNSIHQNINGALKKFYA